MCVCVKTGQPQQVVAFARVTKPLEWMILCAGDDDRAPDEDLSAVAIAGVCVWLCVCVAVCHYV